MKGDKRSVLWQKRLGFEIKNIQWAWCAVDHKNKRVIFQAWVDHLDVQNKRYLFMSKTWERGGNKDMGYNDALEKIENLREGYKLYITFATAVDVKAIPRETKSINDTRYTECTWEQEGDNWYCKIVKHLPC